jgi:hypothetical protein
MKAIRTNIIIAILRHKRNSLSRQLPLRFSRLLLEIFLCTEDIGSQVTVRE